MRRSLPADRQQASDRFQFLEGLELTRVAIHPLRDLVARYGLDQVVPDAPAASPDESRLAGLLAVQCRSVAYNCELR